MKRRDFLKTALAIGTLPAWGRLPYLGSVAHASTLFPVLQNKMLVNIMLHGGPDFRHLFPPAFNENPDSYGYQYWMARAASHSIPQSASACRSRWENDFFHESHGDTEFGILKKCGWLRTMWESGNVAIISNMVGATTRDHPHCRLVMNQGNLYSGPEDTERSGWGGRLAAVTGGNVLSLNAIPTAFAYGPHPSDSENHSNRNLISARDTRRFSLYRPGDEVGNNWPKRHISRSLQGYYQAMKLELDQESIYAGIVDHERVMSTLGEAIDERLAFAPIPAPIAALKEDVLSSSGFGLQIRNLYDCFACSDIFSMRVASLEYMGWDSHRMQRGTIEPKFEDLFGDDKSLDVLSRELPGDVLDNTVFVIGGEFGRQLRANGDSGTDHGRGNAILVIGNGVKGGIYGEMFPLEELERLQDNSPDISGLTTIDSLFSVVCDWVFEGAGNAVFPDRTMSTTEYGLNLASLFSFT
jgi:uncharacterized protein (DUF1501 family)